MLHGNPNVALKGILVPSQEKEDTWESQQWNVEGLEYMLQKPNA
jgi:hypothetical protein